VCLAIMLTRDTLATRSRHSTLLPLEGVVRSHERLPRFSMHFIRFHVFDVIEGIRM
jgi:hypothetical protein